MSTSTGPNGAGHGVATAKAPTATSRLTTDQVWHEVANVSFAVFSHVTPTGEPRSSGVLYATIDRRLYVVVATDSWKARHIATSGRVAVTVPVRRGGILSVLLPIPPATISFHAFATVHDGDALQGSPVMERLAPLLPAQRRASCGIVEVCPAGPFLTYGLGVSLMQMRDPALARARVPVS